MFPYHDGVERADASPDEDDVSDVDAGDGLEREARRIQHHAKVDHHVQHVGGGGQDADQAAVVAELKVLKRENIM